jgi:purine operon repressor
VDSQRAGGNGLTRSERIALLTYRLASRPGTLWSLRELAAGTGAARSTISADLAAVRSALEQAGEGRLLTTPGPAGGIRYLALASPSRLQQSVRALAETLAKPDRVLPGGFLFMTDVLFSPEWSRLIGECFAAAFVDVRADVVVTVETKGVAIALMTARAMGCPLVLLRRDARVTEGPSVSINYLSGSSQRIQSMSVPRRSLGLGARALIIDDFMKGGGTARGMCELVSEVGAQAVGIGVVVATALPAAKKVADYRALLMLEQAVDDGRPMRLRVAPWAAAPAEGTAAPGTTRLRRKSR